MNHSVKCCNFKTRQQESIHQLTDDAINQVRNYSSDELVSLLTITWRDRKSMATIGTLSKERELKIVYQLVTTATCNILTVRDYKRLCEPTMIETITITMNDGSYCQPLGICSETEVRRGEDKPEQPTISQYMFWLRINTHIEKCSHDIIWDLWKHAARIWRCVQYHRMLTRGMRFSSRP